MTAIYFLKDSPASHLADVSAEVGRALADYGAYTVCASLDELREKLHEDRQAIVFFGMNTGTGAASKKSLAERAKLTVQQIRKMLPSAVCIAIANYDEIEPATVFETDCLFLTRPLNPLSIIAQFASAQRQSDLLSAIGDHGQLDEVTNLFNRNYFLKRIGEEISLSKRHLSPLSCVVIGVNFYQMYLDSYGYEFINELFRYLADSISRLVRHEDIVARVSDSEIGIFLPRSTEKGAKVFTNRLVLSLTTTPFTYGEYQEEVSVCAGIAGYPLTDGSEGDADTVIRYARHALHQARCSSDEHIRVRLFSEIQPAL